MNLHQFKQLIERRCGLRFDNHFENNLDNALRRRQQLAGVSSSDAYYALLDKDADEFQELVNLLTINETYFYRETRHLELVTDFLVPRLRSQNSGPIRILSAGCSTGEEPYSLAIALCERFGNAAAEQFQVLGGDIDRQALLQARGATYRPFSFRALSAGLRERYFDPQAADQWRLKESVRSMVQLFHHNLLSPNVPTELATPVDIILYRNVSIYFDPATRDQIIRQLSERLSANGHLIVGSSETMSNDFGHLNQVSWNGNFFFSRDPQLRPTLQPLPALNKHAAPRQAASVATATNASKRVRAAIPESATRTSTSARREIAKPTPSVPDPKLAQQHLGEKRYREALSVACAALEQGLGDKDTRMVAAFAAYQLRELDKARTLGEQLLHNDPWHLDALMLMGNLADQRGDHPTAIGHYKQGLYQRTDCWPMRYLLAEAYRRGARPREAEREYRILQRQLGDQAPDSGLAYFSLGVAPRDLQQLVSRRLQQLGTEAGMRGGC